MAEHLQRFRYENQLSTKSKFGRFLWAICYWILFRVTPRWCLHGWRIFLLRIFGAKIGEGSRIDPSCRIWAPWNLSIGSYTALAEGVDCYCVDRIEIGSKVAISQRSFLCTASHDINSLRRPLIHAPIRIEDHAWVCAQTFIGPGLSLGMGAVVAAGSVVVKDVGDWEVVGGNPATQIKTRTVQENLGEFNK